MAYAIGGRALFVHIPKTGGKWVLHALERAGIKSYPVRSSGVHNGHARLSDIDENRPTKPVPTFSFGFVREPVSWWESLWKYVETPDCKLFALDPKLRHPFDPILPFVRRGLSMSSFVASIIAKRPGFYGEMLWSYVGDGGGLSWIGRTDDQPAALVEALRVAGITLRGSQYAAITRSAWQNVSKPKRSDALSDEVRQLIQETEAEAYRLFGSAGVYTKRRKGGSR